MGHTSMVSSTEAFPGKGAATWITISTPEQVLAQDKRNISAQLTVECKSEVVFSEIINLDKLEERMVDVPEGRNFLCSGSAVVEMLETLIIYTRNTDPRTRYPS